MPSEPTLLESFRTALENDDVETFIANCMESGDDASLNYALLAACYKGFVDSAEELLDAGADIDVTDELGNGVLFTAAINEHPELVEYLLSQGAKDSINKMGETALDASLLMGLHDVVKALGNDNLTQFGYTNLMLALLEKNYTRAQYIIDHATASDLNMVTHGGFSALIIAAFQLSDQKLYSDGQDDAEAEASALQIKALQQIIIKLLTGGANAAWKNKIGISFLSLYDQYNDHLFLDDDFLLQVLNICSSPEFMARHNGRNLFHIGFLLEANLVPAIFNLPNIDEIKLTADLNKLDDDGNSPLSFVLFSKATKIDDNDMIDVINEHGAKFIRNGIEVKSKYHLGILCHEGLGESALEFFDNLEALSPADFKAQLEQVDEKGRNILHLAYMQVAPDLVAQIYQLRSERQLNLHVKDVYGRLPMHYIVEDLRLLPEEFEDFVTNTDNDGLTPLVLFFQRTGKLTPELNTMLQSPRATTILNKLEQENRPAYAITRFIMEMNDLDINDDPRCDAFVYRISRDRVLNFKQKLALFGAIDNLYEMAKREERLGMVSDMAYPTIYNQAIYGIRAAVVNFTPGMALGIELEIPEQPDAICANFYRLIEWFGLKEVQDHSLMSSSISLHKQAAFNKPEVVSPVIQNETDYLKLMSFCDIATKGGAKVNPSAGMHVHVNCRGSNAAIPALPRFVSKDKELIYLKYLAINFISIEPILRGFMRDAAMFDNYGAAYVQPISKYKDRILAAQTVKDLQEICTHNKTLDFTALNTHGTTEFRIHEGSIDPILVKAWIECVSRLAMISREQALAYTGGEIIAKPDIEQLVYLLIAMREYPKTWDKRWGAVLSSETQTTTAYPGRDPRPAQLQIQESPLYNMIDIILKAANIVVATTNLERYVQANLQHINADEKDATLVELLKLVKFTAENPGLNIFPALQAKKAILEVVNSLRDHPRRPSSSRKLRG